MHIRRQRNPRSDALAGRLGLRAAALLVVASGLLVVASGLLAVPAAPASADAPIEGVWSFNGGKVAIEGQGDGTFLGTVVAPTKFAQCTHEIGEQMWTGLALQPDGSYWGNHQWFYETEDCVPNPIPGPTAWRVLQKEGARFLRVCFSAPGSATQPTLTPDGTAANVTFDCVDSARISALPKISNGSGGLPGNKSCLARKRLRIRVRDPKNDPFEKIVVTLKSGSVRRHAKLSRRSGVTVATLSIRGLPTPTFTVTVRATTVLGHHLSAKRTYRRCTGKPRKKGRRHRHSARLHL